MFCVVLNGRRYSPMIHLIKGWYSKYIRNSYSLPPKKSLKMTNRHMKRCETSVIIREMQIKTTMRHHLTSIRMAIINKSTNKCWWECGDKGIVVYCWWDCKWAQLLWKWYGGSSKNKNKTALWLSNTTSEYISKETQNSNLKEYMHPYFHCSIIYNR